MKKNVLPTRILPLSILACLSGCERTEQAYFPLQEGASWEYRVTTEDMDMEKQFIEIVQNEATREIDGESVFTRNVNDSVLYFYRPDDAGIHRIGMKRPTDINTLYEEQTHFVLRYPLQAGTSWEQETVTGVLAVVMDPFRRHYKLRTPVQMTYTVDNVDSKVQVEAGYFEQCVEVTGLGKTRVDADKAIGTINITVASTDWYCPGVGLVKSERVESTDSRILYRGDFEMELISYQMPGW